MSNLPSVVGERSGASRELIQLVSFELGGEEYGVDVMKVREIIRMPQITSMPNTPGYVDGIINLRGAVLPIISLRRRFGMCDGEADHRRRILVMEVGEGTTGFVVDAVAEVLRVAAADIQPPPAVSQGAMAQECINGVINHAERLLIVLDLDRLFGGEETLLLESF
ncbi:chemotaxis protein CheW [Pelobacter propionicus]|uniref:CheW protein n=1 Tax=Pelobacter propionicus (strain DSM 2379 / NBRC 103807 / OttBd1) TaxID=338966 RepID=A1ATM9_PELPD|nr:chemotaxis protein CheW [Pelobacter propionicus]ABL00700.1 CheW protein [Pelobacter propionicus DSM 2379]